MADNTTLYMIIGIALLFALMRANAEPSAAGKPAMSAYLRRRVTLPEVIEIDPMTAIIENTPKQMYIKHQNEMMPQYLRSENLGLKPKAQYIDNNRQGSNLFK